MPGRSGLGTMHRPQRDRILRLVQQVRCQQCIAQRLVTKLDYYFQILEPVLMQFDHGPCMSRVKTPVVTFLDCVRALEP